MDKINAKKSNGWIGEGTGLDLEACKSIMIFQVMSGLLIKVNIEM